MTFPDAVFGNFSKIFTPLSCFNVFTLKLTNVIRDSSSTWIPFLSITNACGTSPPISSVIPITAAASTALWDKSTDSSSSGNTSNPIK